MRGLRELIGQERATERLRALISAERVPHALLFVGPEGVGKATAARLFARALLCEGTLLDGDGCGVCGACIKMDAANHADYHVIANSDRSIKIDAIREAERQLRFRPFEGRAKILVIEDAHKVTVEAQNALLKTLEEPPGTAYIIMTTARLGALLPTVISRCQRVPFGAIETTAIATWVAERLDVPSDDARLAAVMSGGSLGRAFDLDVAHLKTVRAKVVEADRAVDACVSNVAGIALDWAQEISGDRAAMIEWLDTFGVWLHDQIVEASGADLPLENADLKDEIRALAETRGLESILARANSVREARRQLELPFNFNAQMIAEQLFLELAGLARLVPFQRSS
ncbi:MAG: DNA polymerase III subunit delta' [Deltaproteobacteria bacterium]|nr:DNA polymerase III subunit delta' [Deltaproteobacteria bacterium]